MVSLMRSPFGIALDSESCWRVELHSLGQTKDGHRAVLPDIVQHSEYDPSLVESVLGVAACHAIISYRTDKVGELICRW